MCIAATKWRPVEVAELGLVLAAVEVALAVQAVGHRRRAPGSPRLPSW